MPPAEPVFVLADSGPSVPKENPRRLLAAWVLLGLVFGLLIFNALSAYFEPRPASARSWAGETLQFENITSLNQLAASGGGARQGAGQSLDALEQLIRPERGESPTAAGLYAAIQRERGQPIAEETLRELVYSLNPRDQALARIYGPDPLTQGEVDVLVSIIGTEHFLGRLAAVHARESVGDRAARAELLSQSRTLLRVGFVLGGLGVFALGIVLWIYFVICRADGSHRPLGSPLSGISWFQADGLALQVALFLVLMVLLPALLAPFGPIFALVALPLALVAVLALPKYGVGVDLFQALGPKIRFRNALGWGLAGASANLPLVLVVGGLGILIFRSLPEPSHPAVEVLQGSASASQVWRVFLLGVVFAPFLEEVVFRGMLLPALLRVTQRPWVAILISSVLFAAIHPQGIAAWFALATVGAMCAMLTLQTRSLWPAILMHATHNFVLLSISRWML